MRGRKPKPTQRKELEGNPGHRPLNENEPQLPVPEPAFDNVPVELAGNERAIAEWRRLAPLLRKARQVTDAERSALIALCLEYSRYQEANSLVAPGRLIIVSRSGYPMPNPYLGIANRALANCAKLWAELGLTPSSRSRVGAVGEPDAGDPFAEFDAPPSADEVAH